MAEGTDPASPPAGALPGLARKVLALPRPWVRSGLARGSGTTGSDVSPGLDSRAAVPADPVLHDGRRRHAAGRRSVDGAGPTRSPRGGLALRGNPPRHSHRARVRPLLRRPALGREGLPALFHPPAVPVSPGDARRRDPHPLADSEQARPPRHRRLRAPGGSRGRSRRLPRGAAHVPGRGARLFPRAAGEPAPRRSAAGLAAALRGALGLAAAGRRRRPDRPFSARSPSPAGWAS